MAEGKFFYVESRLNGKVLMVKDFSASPGVEVCMHSLRDGSETQLFFQNPLTNSIHSKLNDSLALTFEGDLLCLKEYHKDDPNQRWQITTDRLKLEEDDRVLDIVDGNESNGASLGLWEEMDGDNQLWDFRYVAAVPCFIKSCHNDKVMDVKGADDEEGTKLIMYDQKDLGEAANQLFYEDKYGIIRAHQTELVFDTSEGTARLADYDSDLPKRNWVKNGRKIVQKDEPDVCLEIKNPDKFGMKSKRVQEAEYDGSGHQRWIFEYVNL